MDQSKKLQIGGTSILVIAIIVLAVLLAKQTNKKVINSTAALNSALPPSNTEIFPIFGEADLRLRNKNGNNVSFRQRVPVSETPPFGTFKDMSQSGDTLCRATCALLPQCKQNHYHVANGVCSLYSLKTPLAEMAMPQTGGLYSDFLTQFNSTSQVQ